MIRERHYLSILVVGNIEHFLANKRDLPEIADTVFCGINDLSAEFIAKYQPDVILSPLVTSKYDVIELAIKLEQLNYEGRFRAITAPLPNPDIIVSEIRFECPALDFDLIVLQPDQSLRAV